MRKITERGKPHPRTRPSQAHNLMRWLIGGSALIAAMLCRAEPPCEPPRELLQSDLANYCRIHDLRTICLYQLGYDMSRQDWLVETSDYDGCTARACRQLSEVLGPLSETLIETVCTDPDLDRP